MNRQENSQTTPSSVFWQMIADLRGCKAGAEAGREPSLLDIARIDTYSFEWIPTCARRSRPLKTRSLALFVNRIC
jgi:hypothetical protein